MKISVESPSEVSAEWEDLAERLGATPFQTAGWTHAWWSAFGRGKLSVLAARRNGTLVGILPVVERRGRLSSPTNWHSTDYGPLSEDAEVTNEIFSKLATIGTTRIDSSFLSLDNANALVAVLRSAGYRTEMRTIQQSPYLPTSGDWDKYWSGLSRNLRSTIRRCRNRLSDHGEVSVSVNPGLENLEEQLSEGFAIEGSGWKDEQGTAIASRAETVQFYRLLARYAAERGVLRLAFLRIDGKAAAFNYSVESGGRHYLIKLGHDERLSNAGPGTVLTAAMIERAFRSEIGTYEFLGGADSYKLRWTDTCHDRLRVQAFAPTLAGSMDRLIQIHGRSLARKVLSRQ